MSIITALLVILGLLVVATITGLLWRSRRGRARTVARTDSIVSPALLRRPDGSEPEFGSLATLVQFSTEFCGQCPATRRLLGQIAENPGADAIDNPTADDSPAADDAPAADGETLTAAETTGGAGRERPSVTHIDVDLTHRADLANHFNVLQTPTVLILDGEGHITTRIGGAPARAAVLTAIASIREASFV